MYLDYYGLDKEAFHISPDPEFLFLSPSHKEALAVILYGIEKRTGFMLITGGVGLGKTTILRSALERIDKERIKVILLFNPIVSYDNLVKTIYRELEMELPASRDSFEMEEGLHLGLIEQYKNNRTVVLIIDEAQNLPPETLERLRMLSNLETDKEKLIQIILIGQEPELDNLLDSVQLRQIKQRIAVRARIVPLTEKSSREYILHRLKRAGCGKEIPFTERALRTIIRHAKGIPRTINIVSDNALITGYGYRKKRVTPGIVREVIRDLQGMPRRSFWRWVTIPLAALACLVALLAAFPDLRTYLPAAVNAFIDSKTAQAPPLTQQTQPSPATRVDPQQSATRPREPDASQTLPSKARHEGPVPPATAPEPPASPSPSSAAAHPEKRFPPTPATEPALATPQPRAPKEQPARQDGGVQGASQPRPTEAVSAAQEKPLPPKPMPVVSAPESRPALAPTPGEQPSPMGPQESRPLTRQEVLPSPASQVPSAQPIAPPKAESTPARDPSDLIDWVIDNRAKARRGGN